MTTENEKRYGKNAYIYMNQYWNPGNKVSDTSTAESSTPHAQYLKRDPGPTKIKQTEG